MPRISTDNYDTVASWNGSQDLFVVEQPDGTKVATPAMVKQFMEAGDFEATGEIADGHGNILADKQDTLTFDDAPTASSNNPVKSGGIKTYVDNAVSPKINKTAIQMGRAVFPSAAVGVQTVTVTFPTAFTHKPQVMVTWDDNQALPTFFKYPLNIADITTTGFTVKAERLIASENWWFRYIAVDNQ